MTPDDEISTVMKVVWYCASVGVSAFASVARLMTDHADKSAPIPARAWAVYIITGTAAGLLFMLALFKQHGEYSHLLLFVSGAAGFTGVQALSALALALTNITKKIAQLFDK